MKGHTATADGSEHRFDEEGSVTAEGIRVWC